MYLYLLFFVFVLIFVVVFLVVGLRRWCIYFINGVVNMQSIFYFAFPTFIPFPKFYFTFLFYNARTYANITSTQIQWKQKWFENIATHNKSLVSPRIWNAWRISFCVCFSHISTVICGICIGFVGEIHLVRDCFVILFVVFVNMSWRMVKTLNRIWKMNRQSGIAERIQKKPKSFWKVFFFFEF